MAVAENFEISIIKPDDWHLHLRDGEEMRSVVSHTARVFSRALIMPNLVEPVNTCEKALAYRKRILNALPPESKFNPLMAIYLGDQTSSDEIQRAAEMPEILSAKLYPLGATTRSEAGVSDIKKIFPLLELMQKLNLPLCVHAEVTDKETDIFDRESVFIERHLSPIVKEFPELSVVFEHVTTKEGVDFVLSSHGRVAGTITAHHLLIDRNDIFSGGLRPHLYCLPVAKSRRDRDALLRAAASGDSRFFAGTDSAPHHRAKKESGAAPAGIFSAPAAVELYAEVFDNENAMDKLESFLSLNGARFYGVPLNTEKINLIKRSKKIPDSYPFGSGEVVPFQAGQTIRWDISDL